MKIVWATDIHLDHAKPENLCRFFDGIQKEKPDVVLISGDITQANTFERDMEKIARKIQVPVLYCLGNHDAYCGSIAGMRKMARELHEKYAHMTYLTDGEIFHISEKTAVLGHDSWYDTRYGNPGKFELADFTYISDLKYIFGVGNLLTEKLKTMGDEAASFFKEIIPRAFATGISELLVVTHVPPFKEASLYRGKPSEPDALPYFSCKAVGDVLLEEMKNRPDQSMTVYCGHTHDKADVQILPNLRVRVGGATYGQPKFQVFEKN